ncbi:ribonuclease H2 non-catalytic subunit-domain-containing protein [Lipomyces kononenkoae]
MTTQKGATLNIHIPVSPDKRIRKVTPHILPCKIHYDGPANVRRYFQVHPYQRDASRPQENVSSTTTSMTSISTESTIDDASIDLLDQEIEVEENLVRRQENSSAESLSVHEAYFRGRKLVGKRLVLSEGYKGFILPEAQSLSSVPSQAQPSYLDDEEDEEELHEQEHQWKADGEFSELFVWDHDFAPDDVSNPWIAGINEWISFTSWIHGEHEDSKGDLDRVENKQNC